MLLFSENISLANNLGTLLILFISWIMIVKGEFAIGLYTSFSLYINRGFAFTLSIATVGITLKKLV